MAEINVTPFVDVMLVLLVIFMVTAPLLQAGVEIDLPEAKAPTLDSEDPDLDMLTVEAFGQVRFNDDVISFTTQSELREKLREKLANRPVRPEGAEDVFIQADRNIPYGYVVGIMALLQQMGVDKLGLVTNLPDEGTEPAAPGGVTSEGFGSSEGFGWEDGPRPLEAAPPTTP
jgi:biopolymer transport protein TolR